MFKKIDNVTKESDCKGYLLLIISLLIDRYLLRGCKTKTTKKTIVRAATNSLQMSVYASTLKLVQSTRRLSCVRWAAWTKKLPLTLSKYLSNSVVSQTLNTDLS